MFRVPDDPVNAVVCDDLSVSRWGHGPETRAVDGATFTVKAGEILVVSGPTGSGKSSLLGVLAGQSDDTLGIAGGEARVCGISVRRRGRDRRVLTFRVGYVPQGAGATLPARLTVGETIAEPITSRDRRVNSRAVAVRVAALLDEMHLPLGTADRFPFELSAGMRQRVAFARSLILDPRILIADEPLANIDLEVRHVIYDAIVRRRRDSGMAALIASNDEAFARELGAARLHLHGGHVVAQSADGQVLWTPDTPGRTPVS
ncbi:ATP-binding cassette domain-containing protein [Microbacterium paludicola]|uniref:ATP-binding cassette domain-containing protein n=1 Tax=Microbacterium paludicola TaxID=300019 RepID=A0A4Y9FYN1_9MICO|nr:ATP-binding cassette domain-containing protein [Microbacterium paludicola]MBF0815465.1 ATP-binding cassette domain-containing protein [Microbacterium paludicola]TFU34001.1 ATP-binding cassette domain-containing protein [Microbacterium paludicola]